MNYKEFYRYIFVFISRVVSGFSLIFLSFWISHQHGVEESGFINLFWTIIIAISLIGRFGYDYIILKEIGIYSENQNYQRINKFINEIFSFTSLFTIIIIITSYCILQVFFYENNFLYKVYIYTLIAIFPFTIAILLSLILKGFKFATWGYLLDQGSIAFLILLFLILLHFYNIPYDIYNDYIYFFIVSTVIIIIISYLILTKKSKLKIKVNLTTISIQLLIKVLKNNFKYFMLVFSDFILYWFAILIISYFYSFYETGIYSNILRLSQIIVFIMSILNVVNAPEISSMIFSENLELLEKKLSKIIKINFYLGLLMLIIIVATTPFILDYMHINYINNIFLIISLYLAQLIKIISGPSIYILAMSSNGNSITKISVLSIVLSIVLFPNLIYFLNIEGAGISFFLITLFINGYAIYSVKKQFNISILKLLVK